MPENFDDITRMLIDLKSDVEGLKKETEQLKSLIARLESLEIAVIKNSERVKYLWAVIGAAGGIFGARLFDILITFWR